MQFLTAPRGQPKGGEGLGGSENLRAELELLGFKKEVVARFLTKLEKVCVLFRVTSSTLKRLPVVDYGKQLIENTLYETRVELDPEVEILPHHG
jgi:hypothetical protein